MNEKEKADKELGDALRVGYHLDYDMSWVAALAPMSKDEFAIWALEDTVKRMKDVKKKNEKTL